MPLGRALESASVNVLLNKLASQQFIDFFFKWKLDTGLLTKLQTTLQVIYAVLDDAEEKQAENDPHVKNWLDKVRDAAYDAEDILEEIAIDALESRNKVPNFIYESLNLSQEVKEGIDFKKKDIAAALNPFGERIDSKMRNIVERLEDIVKQKDILRLRENTRGIVSGIEKRLTTPLVNEEHVFGSPIYGRDGDKEEMIKLLTSCEENSDEIRVIPIVGMGGLGKTTLAQIVYNDERVKKHFQLKAWACVSDEFEVKRITKALVESATKRTCGLNNLELLQSELRKMLNRRKFLLVLDDVWNEDYGDWDKLRIPLAVGSPGSKIIVTTRSERVASIMRPGKTYPLKGLSSDDCWSLLEQIAFPNGNSYAFPELKVIAEGVARKCKGLPLAAKSLGGLLRSNPNENYWKDILNSKIWDFSNNGIIPPLRLSYHHLPPHLKQCFVYCAVFPKDFEFDIEMLVLLWIAEGFVQQPEGGKEMEAMARSYFFDLLSRSFFQQSSVDKSQYLMHDLIHDLAQFISGKEFLRLEDKAEVVKQSNIYEKARHFSYIRGDTDVYVKFKPLSKVKCLRTFLSLDPLHGFKIYCLTKKVPEDLLPELRFLRVLWLSGYEITKLPDSIGSLKHLRYLNLSYSSIKELPESTSTVYATAKMSGKLSISGLQNVVNVRDAIEAKLEDKEYLEKLVLEWIGIFDGTRDEKVENEILDMLQPHENLKNLSIEYYGGTEFPSWVGDPSFSKMEYLNLKGCKKCISLPSLGQLPLLKELIIEGMDGIKHVGPQFYGDDYSSIDPFQSLETLKFENIEEWEEWSSFGDGGVEGFPCLRELSIFKCPKLTRFSHRFSSLEKLCIERCQELAAFSRLPSPENLESEDFPRLRVLRLVRCPKLSKLPNYLPSLEGVWIDDCEKLAVLPKLVKLLNLDLLGSNVEILGTMVDLRFMQQSAKLEELKIVNCGDLVALSNQQLGLAHLASLRRLTISGCPKLVALPDEVNKMPPRLESLDIKDCHNLEKLPDELFKLESLSELRVEGCQKLESFPDMGLPSKLKRLVIQNCGAMKAIQDGNLRSNTSLEFLEIRSCSSLVSVLEGGIPTTLKYMRISYCKSLKSLPVEMMNNDMSLEYLEIEACASLLSFPVGELPKSLKRLEISICGNFLSLPSSLLNLVHLDFLHLENCPLLEYFPNTGLPTPNLRKLTIATCKKLKFLPNRFHNLKSLQKLALSRCPSLVSLPKQGLPTNLISLEITRCEKLNPIDEWKLHKLTTLRTFLFEGIPGLVSFSNTYLLPDSITFLHIQELPDLLSISEGLQNLTSLETLKIRDCHKLQALPKEGLPATLSSLTIKNCPLIQSRCMEILDQVLVEFFHTGGREILSGCFSGSTHVIFLEKVPFLESKDDDGLHKWVA
ncbi:putative disease resistance RPP13-like protein 1 [Vitis vinifera]|uniref:Putative disease resistance RPP13-like protein 1 n=1 Tax=Vitis vinifera TaxID=29760 RepID=A0A438IUC8_VITVI|nr:putative disease resistance RPP13-like protein 1 [Vitis vinifera]